MEVVLVLLHVVVVLADARVILERARVSPPRRVARPRLNLEPRALHLREVRGLVAVAREQSREALRVLVAPALEHALDAHGVEVPVGEVHLSRVVGDVGRAVEIARAFQKTRLREQTLDRDRLLRALGLGAQPTRDRQGVVDDFQRGLAVADAVEVVRVENGRVRQARVGVWLSLGGAGEFV